MDLNHVSLNTSCLITNEDRAFLLYKKAAHIHISHLGKIS